MWSRSLWRSFCRSRGCICGAGCCIRQGAHVDVFEKVCSGLCRLESGFAIRLCGTPAGVVGGGISLVLGASTDEHDDAVAVAFDESVAERQVGC